MNIAVKMSENNSRIYASFGELGKVSDGSYLKKGLIWYCDTDRVSDKEGNDYGTLADCMGDNYIGFWFFVRTENSDAGSSKYPAKYTIDGANGYINLRDYVIWTGNNLLRVNTYEAKASTLKNPDGKYSPKSGVDGLMSSTMAAYLTDLINAFWEKTKLDCFYDNEHMCNWLREDGVYLGGLKTDCGGHPPYVGGNTTNFIVIVLNNKANDINPNNHRIQIAFDLSNIGKVYVRKGWVSNNTWGDWIEFGKIADGTITMAMLESTLQTKINSMEERIDGLIKEVERLNV